jgi:O-antigen ligase
VFGEHGILGVVVWMAMFGFALLNSWNLQRLGKKEPRWRWISEFQNMIQGALAAYIVSGSFLDAAYFDLFYYLISMVVIMKTIVALDQRGEATHRHKPWVAQPAA